MSSIYEETSFSDEKHYGTQNTTPLQAEKKNKRNGNGIEREREEIRDDILIQFLVAQSGVSLQDTTSATSTGSIRMQIIWPSLDSISCKTNGCVESAGILHDKSRMLIVGVCVCVCVCICLIT